ncbi:MAG: electron transfer flavoprotein subunit alpha/FixB family protein [Ignavibacteriaceae bacterium]
MQNLSNEVWVFIEQRNGKPADVSLELLCKGRKLAGQLHGPLKAVVIGEDVKSIAADTFKYGANEVLLIQHKELKNYRTLPYSRILNDLIIKFSPRIVLFGATVIGRDLAPRVASNTKSGLTADCTELRIDSITYLGKECKDILLQIRPAFGGNIIATIITPDNPVQMATVREGVMELAPLEVPNKTKITEISFLPDPTDALVEIIEQFHQENIVNLKGAPVIIAGGYGLGRTNVFTAE